MHTYTLNEVSIKTLNYSLIADTYIVPQANKVILFFAGYGSDKERNGVFLKELVEETGASVVCMNLSGHGSRPIFELSDTRPAQHLIEAECLYEWATKEFKDQSIILMGNSYGAYIIAQLSTYKPIGALILRAPAIYPFNTMLSRQPDIDREYISNIYRKDVEALEANPLFSQLSLPHDFNSLVMIHGNDEDVPVQTTDRYVQALNGDSYLANGIYHSFGSQNNDISSVLKYKAFLYQWIKDL